MIESEKSLCNLDFFSTKEVKSDVLFFILLKLFSKRKVFSLTVDKKCLFWFILCCLNLKLVKQNKNVNILDVEMKFYGLFGKDLTSLCNVD